MKTHFKHKRNKKTTTVKANAAHTHHKLRPNHSHIDPMIVRPPFQILLGVGVIYCMIEFLVNLWKAINDQFFDWTQNIYTKKYYLGSCEMFKFLCREKRTSLKNRKRVSSISWHLINTDFISST